MTNIIEPAEGTVTYEAVLLESDHHNKETGDDTGLLIDGITVRIDDIYFASPENEGDDVEMRVDYKLVDGIPDNIEVFESRLINVMIQITNSYNNEKGE